MREKQRRGATQLSSGFSMKKVRTLSKKPHNFAENSKSPEKGETHRTCGGRGEIPPLKPPFRPARFVAWFLGNFWDKCKRQTRRKNEGAVADQRDSHRLSFFYRKRNCKSRDSKRPTSASMKVSDALYAHIRTASALPTVANRNRGARPPHRYVLGANNIP